MFEPCGRERIGILLPRRLGGEAFQLGLRLPPTDEPNDHLALGCPFDVHGPDVFPTRRVNEPPAPLLRRESAADLYGRTEDDPTVGESDLDALTLSVLSQWSIPRARRHRRRLGRVVIRANATQTKGVSFQS